MSRPNSKWLIVPALVLAVVAGACGSSGEEYTLLNKYFMASRVSDNMTLANIATVSFDPKADGQMMSFKVVTVSPEKVEPLEIKQHAADLQRELLGLLGVRADRQAQAVATAQRRVVAARARGVAAG